MKDVAKQSCMIDEHVHVLLYFIAIALIHEGLACKIVSTTGPYQGLYCGNYYIRNTSRISRQQCTTECMRSKDCYVLSYNNVHEYCLIGDHPCSKVLDSNEFEMQIIKVDKVEECVRWTDDQSAFQPGRVEYGSQLAVIRIAEVGAFLPGKWKQTRSTAQTATTEAIHSERWQVLLIAEGCTASWLPYDPSSEPLPINVVLGGRFDDGTPLYVAKGLYGRNYQSGYYNPRTQKIHFESTRKVHTRRFLHLLTVV